MGDLMMLTEEEARKQACPLIRYCVNEDSVVQNNLQPLYVHQLCQGSDCKIGWRWASNRAERGYCGAFGRPES